MFNDFLLQGKAVIDVSKVKSDLSLAMDAVTSKSRSIGSLNTNGFSQPLGRLTGQAAEFTKSLDAANARVIAFGASAGAILAVKYAFSSVISSTIEVEDSLVKINVLLGLSKGQLSSFGSALFATANKTATVFKDAAAAATEFSRQGLNAEDTLKRVEASLTLAKLSGLGYEDSVKSITAAMNSFSNEAMSAMEVVDKFAAVDARFAVSAADLALAVSRVGSSAGDAKVGFNELLAVVAAAQQITARGGAVIGNSFKTIFTRVQRPAVIAQLEELGIKTRGASGEMLPMMQILRNLSNEYDSLSESQRSQTSELIGGVFQINILKAVMRDLANGTSIYDGALKAANGSSGEATKRMLEQNDTIQNKLIVTLNKLSEASANVGNIAFKPVISSGLGLLDEMLSKISTGLTTKTPGIMDYFVRSILDGLGKVISGPGLQLLTFSLFKLFGSLGQFAVTSGAAFLGINTQASQRLAIENQVNAVLMEQPKILSGILSGEISIQSVSSQMLRENGGHIALLRERARLTKEISASLFSQGLGTLGGTAVIIPRKGKSSGHVPNFSDNQAEEYSARSLGASSSVRAHMGKGTIGGKRFLMNNEETEIPNFGGGRDSAVIPHYYNGYSNGHPNGIGEKDLMSPRARIERLKKMLDAGQLSQADYNRARARRSNENAVVQNGILTLYNNGKMTMGYATMDESKHYVKDAKAKISPKNLGTTAYNRLLELFPGQIKENMHVVISGMNYAPIKLSQKEFQRISADITGHSFESLMFGPKYRPSNDFVEVEDAQKWLGKTRAKRYNLTNVFGGFELKNNKDKASTASAASKFINQYFSGGHIPNFSNRYEDFMEKEYPYTLGSDSTDGKDIKKRYRDSLKTGAVDAGSPYNVSSFRSQGNPFPGLTTKRYVRMNPKTFGADAGNSIDYYSDTKTIKVNYLSNYGQSPGGARGLYRLFSTLAKRGAKKIDAGYIVGRNVPNIKKLADKLGMEIYGYTGSSLTPQEAAKLTQGSETLRPSGYEPGFSYKPKSYAGGHLQKAIAREISSGYSASQVRIGRDDSLVSDLNPSGIGVFNSTEGSLLNGISLARRAGINPKTKGKANGHIPNFAEESASGHDSSSGMGGIGGNMMMMSMVLGTFMSVAPKINKALEGFTASGKQMEVFNQIIEKTTKEVGSYSDAVKTGKKNITELAKKGKTLSKDQKDAISSGAGSQTIQTIRDEIKANKAEMKVERASLVRNKSGVSKGTARIEGYQEQLKPFTDASAARAQKAASRQASGFAMSMGAQALGGFMPDTSAGRVGGAVLDIASVKGQIDGLGITSGLSASMMKATGVIGLLAGSIYFLDSAAKEYGSIMKERSPLLEKMSDSIGATQSGLAKYSQGLSALESAYSDSEVSTEALAKIQREAAKAMAALPASYRARLMAQTSVKGKQAILQEAGEEQANKKRDVDSEMSGGKRIDEQMNRERRRSWVRFAGGLANPLLLIHSFGADEKKSAYDKSSLFGSFFGKEDLDKRAMLSDTTEATGAMNERQSATAVRILGKDNQNDKKTGKEKSSQDIIKELHQARTISATQMELYNGSKDSADASLPMLRKQVVERQVSVMLQKEAGKEREAEYAMIRNINGELQVMEAKERGIVLAISQKIKNFGVLFLAAKSNQLALAQGSETGKMDSARSGLAFFKTATGADDKKGRIDFGLDRAEATLKHRQTADTETAKAKEDLAHLVTSETSSKSGATHKSGSGETKMSSDSLLAQAELQNIIKRTLSEKETTPANFLKTVDDRVAASERLTPTQRTEAQKGLADIGPKAKDIVSGLDLGRDKAEVELKLLLESSKRQEAAQLKLVELQDRIGSFGKMPETKEEQSKFEAKMKKDVGGYNRGDVYSANSLMNTINALKVKGNLPDNMFSGIRDVVGRGMNQNITSMVNILGGARGMGDISQIYTGKEINSIVDAKTRNELSGGLSTKSENEKFNTLVPDAIRQSNREVVDAINNLSTGLEARMKQATHPDNLLFVGTDVSDAEKGREAMKKEREKKENERKDLDYKLSQDMLALGDTLTRTLTEGFKINNTGQVDLKVDLGTGASAEKMKALIIQMIREHTKAGPGFVRNDETAPTETTK